MTESTTSRLAKVHERCMKAFDAAYEAGREERAQCREDRRFYSIAGAQWEDWMEDQFVNTPRPEVNKTHSAVMRLVTDYRNNRISVNFRPKDDAADPETADAMDGLYRADENECDGQDAYDNAFEEGVGGGIGGWRLRAAYENEGDEEDDRQRIRMEPIYDADTSMYFDVDAKRHDKSDARKAWVISAMSPDAFKDAYPDEDPASFDKQMWVFDWWSPDVVYVAEYYEIEDKSRTICVFRHVATQEEAKHYDDALDDDKRKELADTGWDEVRRRKVQSHRVRKYVVSGCGVLSDDGYIPGQCIPIVPYYAKRWFVDNVERVAGKVRYMKDPARIYNTQIGKMLEIAGISSHEVPILFAEQVEGLEYAWARGNIDRAPYRLIRPMIDPISGAMLPQGVVGMISPPQVPPALAALAQVSSADLAELSGTADAGEEVVSNVSADAIELVQNKVDMQSYIYMDNFKKAMRRSGEIWRSMAGDLYVEDNREMDTLGPDGSEGRITLAAPHTTATGKQILLNDFVKGVYKVIVDTGPSSRTRKDATVRALIGMSQAAAQTDVELSGLLLSTAMINMDGEGIDDVQKYLRMKLIKNGVLKPNEEEQAQLAKEQDAAANAPPDPQAELVKGATEQARAEAQKAQAQTVKTMADVELVKAKTAQTVGEIDGAAHDRTIATIDAATRHIAATQPAI